MVCSAPGHGNGNEARVDFLFRKAENTLYKTDIAWKFCLKEYYEADQLARDIRIAEGRRLPPKSKNLSSEVLTVFDVLDPATIQQCIPSSWNYAPSDPGETTPVHHLISS